MATVNTRIAILTFPQHFDGANLHLRVLVVPRLSVLWNGNPLQPLIAGTPAFGDGDLQLEARIINSLAQFPASTPPAFTVPLPPASGVRPDARGIFEELVANVPGRFKIAAVPRLAEPVDNKIFIMKYLPRSYRQAFLFTGPRTEDAITDDRYHCAIKDRKGLNPAFQPTPDEVSWGQVYAYCLRHFQLAERLGLIRVASLAVPLAAGAFADGGFLYVHLAPSSAWAAQAATDFNFVSSYAARIPRLTAGQQRSLFSAVLFPVLFDDPGIPGPPQAPGNYDEPLREAAEYDRGFAKIVHARQPVSQNLLEEDPDGFSPLTDVGIQLGWDDEQILIWQNRQLKEDPTVPVVPGADRRLDAPMGIFGYRIDARIVGDAAWHSLVRVRSKAPLQLGQFNLTPQGLFEGELGIEVHPMQLDGFPDSRFWLPSYLAHWNGKSLVLPDEDAAALYKTDVADGRQAQLARLYDPLDLENIPLRYGNSYEFRVRLMDPTSGGPELNAPEPDDFGRAAVPFRRYVRPEPVRIADLPTVPEAPVDSLFTGDSLTVARPLLGYPSVVFTGKYADPIPLLQAASDAAIGVGSWGIPDPDVQRVRIDVEIRTLHQDHLLSLSQKEPYVLLYTTNRDFPAEFDQSVEIPLTFRDAHVLQLDHPQFGDLGVTQAELDAAAELTLPTARDIRLTIRAVASDDPVYFANDANNGKPVEVNVRRESADETDLLGTAAGATPIRGIWLQPDPPNLNTGQISTLLFERITGNNQANIVERLAQQLGVERKGMTLTGDRGQRIVFGCSRRVRHTLAPDKSSITLSAKEDLVNHWLVALRFELRRDWTWDGLSTVGFEIFREQRNRNSPEVDDNGGQPVGDLELLRTAPLLALDRPERTSTTLIYIDAVEPKSDRPRPGAPGETRFPDIIDLTYRIEPRFSSPPQSSDPHETLSLSLPVTTPPVQVPKVVSAGIALSPYERAADYSSTEARQKFLWIELEQPLLDPNDGYFIRMLGYAPDPLISDNRLETFLAPEESPLPIDPELIRVIAPEQADDNAGLSAMSPLEAADGPEGRHFLVPIPPGMHPDSAELFGFFTYELRVGHAKIWSTAQGRFGRPLRVTGVQHPAPTLFCAVERTELALRVSAPYAQAVLSGKNVTADPPNTEIWALLYAQVRQADGKDFRNILLQDRKMRRIPPLRGRIVTPAGSVMLAFQNLDAPARAQTEWTQKEIVAMLRQLGLPDDSPISVLCVEMLPTTGTPAQQSSTAAAGLIESGARPLSDELGHYRILRTSPLTPAPAVCCPDCKPV